MSAEIQTLRTYLQATGVSHRVTSTLRPNDDGSRHSLGLAVDFAGPHPSWNSPELLAIFEAFRPVEPLLFELIYSGAEYSIKRGQRVARYAISSHWDHVHVAVDRGVRLPIPTDEGFAMPDNPDLPNITGPVKFNFYTDPNTGQCIGYHIYSEATAELHGHGPGAPYFGRSEVVNP